MVVIVGVAMMMIVRVIIFMLKLHLFCFELHHFCVKLHHFSVVKSQNSRSHINSLSAAMK